MKCSVNVFARKNYQHVESLIQHARGNCILFYQKPGVDMKISPRSKHMR